MRLDDRLEALLAQMTLEEKVGQLGIFADMLRPFAPGINPEMNEQDATQTLELVRSGRAGALFNGIGAALGREAQGVAVEETRLPGLADHCVIPSSHSGLVFSAEATRQAAHFLREGRFHQP